MLSRAPPAHRARPGGLNPASPSRLHSHALGPHAPANCTPNAPLSAPGRTLNHHPAPPRTRLNLRLVRARSSLGGSGGGLSPPPPPPPPPPPTRAPSSDTTSAGDGTFALILLNVAVFALARLTPLPIIPTLALVHSSPAPWQFLSCAFTHYDFAHLAGNLFSLLVFGRMVEEEEGAFGVVGTYVVCGIAAAAASYLALPSNSISLGASGSVFGLFVVAVAAKLRPSLKKLVECGVLSVYVWSQISNEVRAQASVMAGRGAVVAGSGVVAHCAHIAGALAGGALVALLSRLPAADE